MDKPHPVDLRARVVAPELGLAEQGHTHTAAARPLCVSVKFVNNMVRLKRETGSLAPKPQGNPGRGKLTGVKDWVRGRIAVQPDLTIDELTTEFAAAHGLKVHRPSVGRRLLRLGGHTKKICAVAQGCGHSVSYLDQQAPAFMANHLERLVSIDEAAVTINIVKTTGWAPRGQRLVDYAPFGHSRTQTFIGALRTGRLDAPWVINGTMNGEMFDLYVQTQLVPTLRKGDVVILDNLSSHKSLGAAQALRGHRA